jgi:hypothetical protein
MTLHIQKRTCHHQWAPSFFALDPNVVGAFSVSDAIVVVHFSFSSFSPSIASRIDRWFATVP